MKKILSTLIGGAILATSVLSFGVSAASIEDFSDMPNDWSTPALTAAVNNGLLTGSDGLILPKDNLTRAQMATIVSRAFGAKSTASLEGFTDVPSDKWYYEYMQKAVAMGVFTGDGSGLLTPDNNITREQVFAVLARAFKLEAGDDATLEKFADKDSISSWAKGYASALVAGGYVNGSDDGTGKLYLNPKNNITRAEFAQIMYNMIKYYIDKEGDTLTGEYDGSVIIRASDILVDKTVVIKGNLVICEGVTNITIEDETAITKIIDNRKPDAADDKKEEDKVEDKKEEEKKDDTVHIVVPGTSTTTPTTPDTGDGETEDDKDFGEVESGDDDEGWSAIYRP